MTMTNGASLLCPARGDDEPCTQCRHLMRAGHAAAQDPVSGVWLHIECVGPYWAEHPAMTEVATRAGTCPVCREPIAVGMAIYRVAGRQLHAVSRRAEQPGCVPQPTSAGGVTSRVDSPAPQSFTVGGTRTSREGVFRANGTRVRQPSRDEAREINCTQCGASAGEPCRGKRGPRLSNHQSRAHRWQTMSP
jgi:hypothetical protein